jgi:hypothetical protein
MPGFQSYRTWLFSAHEERYRASSLSEFSLILQATSMALFVIRRLCLLEHAKHIYRMTRRIERIPAWFVDSYILLEWILVLLCFRIPTQWMAGWWWLPAYWNLQLLAVVFFHEVWRTGRFAQRYTVHTVHSRLRNVVIAMINFGMSILLFALAYRWTGATPFSGKIQTDWQAVYFSAIVAGTVGLGDITPSLERKVEMGLVVYQIFSSLFLIAIALSISVGALHKLEEHHHVHRRGDEV